ncbi:MAG TPA: bifunctional glutamate N-acetyltransferase/amino-acid acetyltransferase ArgJ [Gammaproteobacteria bacterium]|nr:bifunctional glutamate N-acetyltransferase/amino-acid acetyltransferase ArgJ [Gammaproteobacteria bacterium]
MKSESLPVLHPVAGFRLGTTSAGIRKPGRQDLVVMELAEGSACAAVFTRNEFCAAPVIVAREHIAGTAPACLIVNTGNANAGTGATGLADARACCDVAAGLARVVPEAVLPFSTGVIGEPLAVDRLIAGLPGAFTQLSEDGWAAAATGIMTTDTVPKGASRRIELDGHAVTVTGIAKGSGMIRPDMATMLAFIATDAAVDTATLQRCLWEAVDKSFNRITVDGDTSTNDACVLVATGKSPAPRIVADDASLVVFGETVTAVCVELAQAIVRDGEGATRFVTVTVEQGADSRECLQVAYTIAHSPLVKTALFAGDPNWGRILAAVGRAGIGNLDIAGVEIYLDDVCIVRDGGRAASYAEADGERVLSRSEYEIRVVLGRGESREQVWTCDLSYDYVKINAEYRS